MIDPRFGLYIHIPWCWSKCPYCDFNAYALKSTDSFEAYTNQLMVDLHQTQQLAPSLSSLQSIYLGGGTPSLLPPKELERLFQSISELYPWHQDLEVSMEISPKTESSYLKDVLSLGVNRFSVGLQSFQPHTLSLLGREHHAGESHQIIDSLIQSGARHINVDLIYGLAEQTSGDVLEDLTTALEAPIEHVSWYELMIEPNTVFAKKPWMKTSIEQLDIMEEQGQALLTERGWEHYEVSAYCREGRVSRHNSFYWRYGDYLGIGAGAHSKITQDDRTSRRFSKTRYPKDYLHVPKIVEDHSLNEPFDYLLNRLRLFEPISWTEMAARLHPKANAQIKTWVQTTSFTTFIEQDEDGWSLTTRGRQVINDLLEDFLRYQEFLDNSPR